MEDGEHCCIASPPDTSVTSSTSCTDDQSVKTVHMSNNVQLSDEDTEVSSSCEMLSAHPASSSTAVDPLDHQVNPFTLPCGNNAVFATMSQCMLQHFCVRLVDCVRIIKWTSWFSGLRLPSAIAPSPKIRLLSWHNITLNSGVRTLSFFMPLLTINH